MQSSQTYHSPEWCQRHTAPAQTCLPRWSQSGKWNWESIKQACVVPMVLCRFWGLQSFCPAWILTIYICLAFHDTVFYSHGLLPPRCKPQWLMPIHQWVALGWSPGISVKSRLTLDEAKVQLFECRDPPSNPYDSRPLSLVCSGFVSWLFDLWLGSRMWISFHDSDLWTEMN